MLHQTLSRKQEELRERTRLSRKAYAEANIRAAEAKFGRELSLDERRYFHSISGMMSEAWDMTLTDEPSPDQALEHPTPTAEEIELDLAMCVEKCKSDGLLREIE